MNSIDKITQAAQDAGNTVTRENFEVVVRTTAGVAVASATFVDGRFHGGYTVDSLGHVVSHTSVRDLVGSL